MRKSSKTFIEKVLDYEQDTKGGVSTGLSYLDTPFGMSKLTDSMVFLGPFLYQNIKSYVKESGFDPMTQGSAVQIPAVAELSFGIQLTF